METIFLIILALMLVVLTGLLIVVIKAVTFFKEALFLMRSKFDADFLRRFDMVFHHLTKENKFKIVIGPNGKAKKVMKDDRY